MGEFFAQGLEGDVYTQQALKATAYIAGVLNERDVQAEYQQLSEKLVKKINENFWDEQEASYCDFYGDRTQAIRAAEGSITQIQRQNPEGLDEEDF